MQNKTEKSKEEQKIAKELFSITLIISAFILTLTFASLYVYQLINANNVCGCIVPLPYMLIGIGLVGVLTGSALSYFFTKQRFKHYSLKSTKTPNNDKIKQEVNFYKKIIPKEQQKVLDYIIEKQIIEKKKVKQIEINKLCSSRVKSHRILKDLEKKDIITKERDGKCILIKLKE